MKTLVIVPTRGRPASARRLLDRFAATCTGDTQLLFAVDEDDPELDGYLALKLDGAWVEVGPRLRLVGTLNARAVEFADRYDLIGFLGDDHLPQTYGWDRQLEEAAVQAGPGGIAYGNDLFQGENLPTAVMLDTRIVRTLGYMAPPQLQHMYADDAWKTWGTRTGKLRYLQHTIIEHLHPHAGKSDADSGYADVWPLLESDGVIWRDYEKTQLGLDIAKLETL